METIGKVNKSMIKNYNPNNEACACIKCDGTHFEEVRVSRYVKHHTVQLGQPVPQVEPVTFILLRCVKCAELYEPNLQLATYDVYRKPYEVFRKEFDEAIPQNTSPDPNRPTNS